MEPVVVVVVILYTLGFITWRALSPAKPGLD